MSAADSAKDEIRSVWAVQKIVEAVEDVVGALVDGGCHAEARDYLDQIDDGVKWVRGTIAENS